MSMDVSSMKRMTMRIFRVYLFPFYCVLTRIMMRKKRICLSCLTLQRPFYQPIAHSSYAYSMSMMTACRKLQVPQQIQFLELHQIPVWCRHSNVYVLSAIYVLCGLFSSTCCLFHSTMMIPLYHWCCYCFCDEIFHSFHSFSRDHFSASWTLIRFLWNRLHRHDFFYVNLMTCD